MRHVCGDRKLWVLLGLCCAASACRGSDGPAPSQPARRAADVVVAPPPVEPPVLRTPDAGPCPGALACNGRCVDPQTDAAHCGACGHACVSSAVCLAGVCRPAPQDAGAGACPVGQVRCGPYCTITATDPLHCGRCDNHCLRGQSCAAGLCVAGVPGPDGGPGLRQTLDAGSAPCAAGQVRCGSYCATTATDPLHCGRCDNRCAPGQICAAGLCATAGPGLRAPPTAGGDGGPLLVTPARCVAPQVSCGAYCANTSNDPFNCGRCGARCATGQVCVASRCGAPMVRGDGGLLPVAPAQCAAPQVSCGAYCATTGNDPLNCGGCGLRCATGQVCVAGRCSAPGTGLDGGVRGVIDAGVARCAAPQVSCGAYCATTGNDPLNCGGCGLRCATGQVCVAGRCSVVGPPFDATTRGVPADAPPG